MKCSNCGQEYNSYNYVCPNCGNATYTEEQEEKRGQPNKIAAFLNKTVPGIKLDINYLGLILVIICNIGVLSIVANIITYFVSGYQGIWVKYVLSGLAAIYAFLKISLKAPEKVLRNVRDAVYIILLALNIAQFIEGAPIWVSVYVTPICIGLLSIYAVGSYMMGKSKTVSFFTTLVVNLGISALPFILLIPVEFFAKYWAAIPYAQTGAIITMCVSIGITALIVVNFLFIRLLSLFTSIKKRF